MKVFSLSESCLGACLSIVFTLTPAAAGWEDIAPPRLAPVAEGVQLDLINAVTNGDRDGFEAAMEAGADPNSVAATSEDRWALCEATGMNQDQFDPYFLLRLLEEGADPNIYSPLHSVFEDTALACALTVGSSKAIELLADAGADDSVVLCPQCSNPDTPFTRALRKRSTVWFALDVLDRRSLSAFELETMRDYLAGAYLDGEQHEGRDLRDHLEGYLLENGGAPLDGGGIE